MPCHRGPGPAPIRTRFGHGPGRTTDYGRCCWSSTPPSWPCSPGGSLWKSAAQKLAPCWGRRRRRRPRPSCRRPGSPRRCAVPSGAYSAAAPGQVSCGFSSFMSTHGLLTCTSSRVLNWCPQRGFSLSCPLARGAKITSRRAQGTLGIPLRAVSSRVDCASPGSVCNSKMFRSRGFRTAVTNICPDSPEESLARSIHCSIRYW